MKEAIEALDPRNQTSIRWHFCVDRFGVRSSSSSLLRVDYARQAVRALNFWTDTIETLFGDLDEAMAIATNACLLPQYPYWASISEALGILGGWLGSQDALSISRADENSDETHLADGQIINARTQDYVYQLQLYLEAMQKWAPVFVAGTWIASLAGSGSNAESSRDRLLCGLKTIAAVFEFDSTMEPDAILKRLESSLSWPRPVSDIRPELETLLEGGRKLTRYSSPPPDFSSDPSRFHEWVQDWRTNIERYPHQVSDPFQPSRELLDDAYWSQWFWPPSGAVVRRVIERSTSPTITALDLVYTARYGGLPLLHWRGGILSICQWSRILAIAFRRPSSAFAAPVATGLSNLGFEAEAHPATRPETTSGSTIVLISPHSMRSAAWMWRPHPSMRSLASLPKALTESDAKAAGGDDSAATLASSTEIIQRSVSHEWPSPGATFLRFFEVVDGQASEVPDDDIPWAPWSSKVFWRRIAFGSDGTERSMPPSVSNPHDVVELVELAKQNHPELFPHLIEGETVAARLFYRAGRSTRLFLLWLRTQRKSLARVWPSLKRTFGRGN